MQLTSIYTFLTVARQKSISRAARLLYISQPAVSQQLKRMEKELGFALIDHNTRNGEIVLSEAGQYYYDYMDKALNSYEQMVHKCQLISDGKKQEITIGMRSNDVHLLKQETLDAFTTAHPDVHLNFLYDQTNLLEKLYSEQLDLLFSARPSLLDEAYEYLPCTSDTVICLLRKEHPLAKKAILTIQDLKPYPLYILADRNSYEAERFLKYLATEYPNLHVALEKDRGMSVPPGFKGIRFTAASEKDRFPFSIAIPLKTGFRISKGYLFKKKSAPLIKEFAERNIDPKVSGI